MLNITQLNFQDTYSEIGGSYYQYKLISIDEKVYNNGYNVYFKVAKFSVTTITGRKIDDTTATFAENSKGDFINNTLKLL